MLHLTHLHEMDQLTPHESSSVVCVSHFSMTALPLVILQMMTSLAYRCRRDEMIMKWTSTQTVTSLMLMDIVYFADVFVPLGRLD